MKFFSGFFAAVLFGLTALAKGSHTITVKVNAPTAAVEPTMWGVFFEDINMGADGGLYAELIKNRSFEFFKPLMGWKIEQKPFREGAVTIQNRIAGHPANPRFMHVVLDHAVEGSLSFTNEGFRAMGFKKDLNYDFSLLYSTASDDIKLHVELLNAKNGIIGQAVTVLGPTGSLWKRQALGLMAGATEMKGKCRIWLEGNGEVDLDMLSLFPGDTWKNRPGGLRADMVQLLADMKPGFIRFPGGCIVEGFDLSQRYQWKNTIGPVEERQLIINRWNFEFANRPSPDYFQTFGLGFFEYFQLAEDIGAAALPILNCGMACQFNSAEMVPLNQLDPYIQDALDLIEFANGDPTTTWGGKRAAMGHAAPFNLKFLGIGNENWGPQYLERLGRFEKAVKAKYPMIKLIASSGTGPDGDRFELLNAALRKMPIDLIDEHYYRPPEWFLQNASRYDTYLRTGSRVFAGEYAAHADKNLAADVKNNWFAALSTAAFMTGLERNADVVAMASYAPLFAHIDGWQWAPDLIWVDNLRSYGTPDYYVQKLFSTNKGSKVVPLQLNKAAVSGQDSLYGSAVIDTVSHELIIKLVNVSAKAQSASLVFEGLKKPVTQATLLLLQSDSLATANAFDTPQQISPRQSLISFAGKQTEYQLAPYSFSVLKIKLR